MLTELEVYVEAPMSATLRVPMTAAPAAIAAAGKDELELGLDKLYAGLMNSFV